MKNGIVHAPHIHVYIIYISVLDLFCFNLFKLPEEDIGTFNNYYLISTLDSIYYERILFG